MKAQCLGMANIGNQVALGCFKKLVHILSDEIDRLIDVDAVRCSQNIDDIKRFPDDCRFVYRMIQLSWG